MLLLRLLGAVDSICAVRQRLITRVLVKSAPSVSCDEGAGGADGVSIGALLTVCCNLYRTFDGASQTDEYLRRVRGRRRPTRLEIRVRGRWRAVLQTSTV